jgi:selenophosphate synthetase-related protein
VNLQRIIKEVRDCPGITRKQAIGEILEALAGVSDFGRTLIGPGDDAAVIDAGDRYLLLATDGILPFLVRKDPYLAGRAAILVNANDIYAMGGRPIAMVNMISGLSGQELKEVLRGMREECERLCIPMVGGHCIPEDDSLALVVSVLGEAKAVLRGSSARPGEDIVLAIDLDGCRWGDFILNWDSHYRKSTERLCDDLEVMVSLAEEGLCGSARDISMSGILGTIAMMLEASGTGGWVDLDRIEVPALFRPEDWYMVYPSYGFVLTTKAVNTGECVARFHNRGIWAGRVGRVEAEKKFWVHSGGESAILYDFSRQGIMRMARREEE